MGTNITRWRSRCGADEQPNPKRYALTAPSKNYFVHHPNNVLIYLWRVVATVSGRIYSVFFCYLETSPENSQTEDFRDRHQKSS